MIREHVELRRPEFTVVLDTARFVSTEADFEEMVDVAASVAVHDVPRNELRPGDLVFFNTLHRTFSHVGIYIGDGRFIHSPRSGAAIRLESMNSNYWSRRFDGARRAGAVERLEAAALNQQRHHATHTDFGAEQ